MSVDLPDFLTPEIWLAGVADEISVDQGTGLLTWTDRSGNGNHFGQVDDASIPPEIAADGKGVVFAGSDGETAAIEDFCYLKRQAGTPGMLATGSTAWVVYEALGNSEQGTILGSYYGNFQIYNFLSTLQSRDRDGFGSFDTFLYADQQTQAGEGGGVVLVENRRISGGDVRTRVDEEEERTGSGHSADNTTGGHSDYIGSHRGVPNGTSDFPLRATLREVVITHQTGLTEEQLAEVRETLLTRWGPTPPPTEEETFQASFEDASGRDPLPTALLDRTSAKRLANHNVIVYKYPPYTVTKRLPVALEDYDLTKSGLMMWHKDAMDPLFFMGRWAQIEGRRFLDDPNEVELTMRISDHPESFEAPT